jgi:hypothetical protein
VTRLTRFLDSHLDPTHRETPLSDADEAMHPMVLAILLTIAAMVVIGVVFWFFAP